MKLRNMVSATLAGLILFCGLIPGALAEVLELPADLTQIKNEAFKGNRSVETVVVPDGAKSIGASAFRDCESLKSIWIPGSVETIGANAFSGCTSDMLIHTTPGSSAMTYASNNHIDYQADTTYRALIVGQTYVGYLDDDSTLPGGETDAAAMNELLSVFGETPYERTVELDLTRKEMLDGIASVFADAKAQDVSLFYYSGHGVQDTGDLYTVDDKTISPDELRSALDKIPGRKIVIVDACFSGNMALAEARDADDTPEAGTDSTERWVDAFAAAFKPNGQEKGLAHESYYVMAACSYDETSIAVSCSGARNLQKSLTLSIAIFRNDASSDLLT